jgi:hypothetical protein
MTTDTIPVWLPHGVLRAILEDASKHDPARAEGYAALDVERVRRAIDGGDRILAAHRCHGDDDAIDVALARAALIVARGLIRPQTGNADGE